MENNEMIYEEVLDSAVEVTEIDTGNSKIGTGTALVIGVGAALATTAIVKLAKNLWAKHKAKKEVRLVGEAEAVEVTDEEIDSVTK
jgi:hypothetical protein